MKQLVSTLLFVCSVSTALPGVIEPSSFRALVEEFNSDDQNKVKTSIPDDEAWAWMKDNIPRFDASDAELVRTYYFRWWSYRKHLKKTANGWVITEFLPDVPWAGKDNTISCAAGHHLYEGRWLRNPVYLDDYCTFWFRKGGEPRRYSFWAADSLYARFLVNANREFAKGLTPDLIANYEAWEKTNRDPGGLFWQIDDRDGMEKSIGGSGYRPTINSYMYGDAIAISRLLELNGQKKSSEAFRSKAQQLASLINQRLWNSKAGFYETVPRGGERCVAVRELIGFVPWYFNIPGEDHDVAWKQLCDRTGFAGRFGPTTAERRNARFMAFDRHECLWNGPSWPFATTQTLVAMANLLNDHRQTVVSPADYFRLLKIYAHSNRRELPNGKIISWIDEDLNADTGAWIARKIMQGANRPDKNRGEYYNHSGFADLIISGLAGLRPRADNRIEVNPLVPPGTLNYFCLDGVRYHGHDLTIFYDPDGKRYGKGAGLRVFADGRLIGASPSIKRVLFTLPHAE